MLAIRLPDKLEKRLDRLANDRFDHEVEARRTKTYYAREAILKYLDDLEDIYFAEKALEDIRSGRSKPIPLEK